MTGARGSYAGPPTIIRAAHLTKLRGAILEAPLSGVCIGEVCLIREALGRGRVVGRAQVVGFSGHAAVLALLASAHGLSRDVVVEPTGKPLTISLSTQLLGCVVDASGTVCAELGPCADTPTRTRPVAIHPGESVEIREIDTPRVLSRRPVKDRFVTGIRVIDGVLGVGVGQRVVILAPAGVGKTSLLQALATHASADVMVIALIGERGREVSETIERVGESIASRRCVIVQASSDTPAVERLAAATSAMTIAEYFRDQGCHVVLVLDSLTRYARALREVALAAGELPARHGYPASVFERLPRLLERAGNAGGGAITAFFSVLVEHDDELDPIAHEVVSILDGHFVLSSTLASEGHFPAIDIARSVSRVASRIGSPEDNQRAASVRYSLARAAQLALLVEMGEYRPGMVERDDRALACASRLKALFRQDSSQYSTLEATRSAIDDALA